MTISTAAIPSNASSRSSDVSKMDSFNTTLAETMGRYNQAQTRLSTNEQNAKYNTPDMAQQAKAFLTLEEKTSEISALKFKLTQVSGRVKYSITVNQRLQEIASEYRERVMKARDATASHGEFSQFCQDKLKEVEGLLNKTDAEGRNLFAGTATTGKAVDLSLAPVPPSGTSPDPSYLAYFKGETGAFDTQLRPGETFNFGFSADENPVRDLVFWLKLGTSVTPTSNPSDPNHQKMSDILDGLGTTVGSFSDLHSKLGSQLGKLEGLTQENGDDEMFVTQSMQAINEANMLQEFINASMEFTRLSMNQILMQKEMQNAQRLIERI